jgi:hypothetical protein
MKMRREDGARVHSLCLDNQRIIGRGAAYAAGTACGHSTKLLRLSFSSARLD